MTRPALVSLAAIALTATTLLAGCSGDDGKDDGPGDRAGDESGAPVQVDGEWSVSSALAEVPESAVANELLLLTGDLEAAVEAAGLERTAGAPATDWMPPISGIPRDGRPAQVFVPLPDMLGLGAGPDHFTEISGIDLNDVDSFVDQSMPPSGLTVLRGDDLGPSALSDQLVEQDGVLTDIEGDDLAMDLGKRDRALSPVARPTRIRAEDGAIAFASTTPLVQAWRDGGETLADRDDLVAVAASLDEAEVYSAVITEPQTGGLAAGLATQRLTAEQLEIVTDEWEPYLPEQPYDAVGIGWAVDDGQARAHVAYHFADDDAATSALATLKKAWTESTLLQSRAPVSDYVTLEDAATDGSVVTLTVSMVDQRPPSIMLNLLVQREPLFLSR